jgi:flagellar motor switch protein FliN/FliY
MESDMTQDHRKPEYDNAAVNQAAVPAQSAKATNLDTPTDGDGQGNLDFILDIPMMLTVELGRSQMLINELLKLGRGSVIELSKLAGEPLDILANQRLIARGEVVVINEKYGIRITEIISPAERVERLR